MSVLTTADGGQIAYTDHGGDGPALVMLHGFLMDRSMFAPQVEAMSDNYRCITVDERGHGQTTGVTPFDYWDVANDVIAVLDHLGVPTATIAGTSQGGFVALRVALLRPDLVTGLVLMGTSGEVEEPQVAEAYRSLTATWKARGPVDEVIEPIASICLGDFGDAEGWKRRWRDVSGDHMVNIIEPLVTRDDVLSRAGELTVPVLVLHGSEDGAYSVEKAERLAAALPGSHEAVIVPGGAHFLSLTDAETVNQELRGFLAAHA